jgi:PAS domain-containing protein
VPIDALQAQLASALQRFSVLQRRVGGLEENGQGKLLARALRELENTLDGFRVAQAQLLESRRRNEELQEELQRGYRKYWQLFDDMPQPYLLTKVDSTILEANRAAAELVNVSQRFLVGKTLSVFVSEDRGRFLCQIADAAQGAGGLALDFVLRPRERAAVHVSAKMHADGGTLRWIVNPVSAPSAALTA